MRACRRGPARIEGVSVVERGHAVSLRPTGAADLDFVLALEHHPDYRPFIGQWTRDAHLATMAQPDREHWVIERPVDAARLGYIIAYDVRAAGYGMYVKRIAVADWSRGVGRQALRLLVDHAFRDLVAESVCLAVRRHNARAQRAYRAVGFVEQRLSDVARIDMLARVDPFPDECMVMRVLPNTFQAP